MYTKAMQKESLKEEIDNHEIGLVTYRLVPGEPPEGEQILTIHLLPREELKKSA